MDRQIVYVGQIPQDIDILNSELNALKGLGFLAQDILGTSPLVSGLACTPTSPQGLSVSIAPGRLYSLQPIDSTAYGSLAPDEVDFIVKQGIAIAASTLNLTPPVTPGFSVNYLIEVGYADVDTVDTVLPFYDQANPDSPLSGEGNSGAAQPTRREGQVIIQAVPGAAAATGAQMTPAVDSGFIALYVVTVPYGATTIGTANIAGVPGAPFLTETLTQKISGAQAYADVFDSTANQRTFILSASPPSLAALEVSLGGSVLTPGVDYTLAGNVLTLVGNALVGQYLIARYAVPLNVASSAIYVTLSLDSVTLAADSSGNVSSFGTANGVMRVFAGATEVTAECGFAVPLGGNTNCTGTINTISGVPVPNQPAGYYQVTAMSASNATLALNATYNNVTYSKTFALTKAIAGANGAAGTPGTPGAPGAPGAGVGALSIYLTNESMSVSAYADGSVPSFAGINGFAKVFSGATDVTAQCAFTATPDANTSGTINAVANSPVAAEPIGYYQVTALVNSVNSGTMTINAVYQGVTLTKVFTVSKSLSGYQIVTSLPTTSLFVGRIVFLTTDGKLYRYTASGWTPSVAATDITGQLTAAQIASVAAAQLTGQITGTQIQNGSISTAQLAAGSVTSAQIAAGTIVAGDIASNTLTSAQIAAGGITANSLAANSVTTNAIAAGSVTAAEMAVTTLSAISANIGAVTAGTLSSSSGQTKVDLNGGTITFNNGAFMKVSGTGFGSGNQFIEWYGPTQSSLTTCTETNAVYYLKVNGQAYFGGALLAGKLTNSVQGSVLDTTNVASLGPFSSNGGQITITWSYAFIANTIYAGNSSGLSAYNAVTKESPSAVLTLQQSVGGGAFSTVLTIPITNGSWTGVAPEPADVAPGSYRQLMSGSGTYTDNLDTTSTRQYKLSISSWTNVDSTVVSNILSLQSAE